MRQYEDLRGILAQQLSAAADNWSPTPRQTVQQAERRDCDAVAELPVEAVEWLLSLLAVTTVREIH